MPVRNVKPRLRMTALYFVAESLDYLVAGTGNRSALTIGQFTKYGDGAATCCRSANLLKSDVRSLAELGVPQPHHRKPPSAGLWLGQTDEDEMGFSYGDLERYLTADPRRGAGAGAAARALIRASEHKRAAGADRPGRSAAASRRRSPCPIDGGAGSWTRPRSGHAGQPPPGVLHGLPHRRIGGPVEPIELALQRLAAACAPTA